MKIKLISDVHFEFYEDSELYNNHNNANVLVIAGDLDVGHIRCWSALKRFAQNYDHVIYTSGNHEYYHHTIAEFDDYITRFSQGTNIHYLNPGRVTIDGVTFIGAALWSNFGNDVFAQQNCARAISDFRTILDFSTNKCVELYDKHSGYIKQQYEQTAGTKVIVTHFLPDTACVAPEYRGYGAINKYFANDLGNWISTLSDTPLWLFGHTHSCVDITIGDTRVVANPYGYNKNPHYVECLLEI